ncbi:MAG: site-2 protease family protein [Bacteroidota bacterium]
MKGAFRIAVFAGIPLMIHWSFGLILLWILYMGISFSAGWVGMAWMGLLVVLLFTCVVLHEYGHAIAARRFNVDTLDIILFPMGGVARLTRLPDEPMQEFKIALAGPLVNVVLSLFLGVWLFLDQGRIPWIEEIDMRELTDFFLPGLFWMNVFLVLFNLLPAFPMDGGRMLRSLLATRLGRLRATQIAAIIGQVIAVLLFVYSLFDRHLILSLISIFVFLTARHESRMVWMDHILATSPVSQIMRTEFSRFPLSDPINRLLEVFEQEKERSFLVFDELNKVVGVLHEAFVLEAIKKEDTNAPLMSYLSSNYEPLEPADNLKVVLQKMQQHGYSILPVYEENSLVGVVDVRSMNAFIREKRST